MQRQSQPLVSIVTPVHNEAQYLSECIESVLAQTYRNWDYTIVDNCSTDGSYEIAARYAERDQRIRIVRNTQLLPPIPNHNATLRKISPESRYCKVVFGDDLIFPECLERMVAAAEAHSSAGIVSAYATEDGRVMCAGLPYPRDFVTGHEVCRKHLLEGVFLWGSANTVLYKSELVRRHDPFYNETNIHSDTEVCFKLLKESDFAFVHQVLTFTRTRGGSLSTVSERMGTYLAAGLHLLVTYGPEFLSEDEIEQRLFSHVSDYYSFLGKNLVFGRDKQFWSYHQTQLIGAGVGFSRMGLIRGALGEFVKAALSPRLSLAKLSKRRSLARQKTPSSVLSS